MIRLGLLALLLGTALSAATGTSAQEAAGAPDAAAEQRRALESAREDLKGAEDRRRRLAAEVEGLKGERGKLQAGMAAAVEAIRTKEPAVEERSRKIGELAESERQLKASLVARRDVLADVIAALQRMGRQPPPALLVRPNDALEAVRSAILLGAVVPGMRAEAEELGSDLRQMVRLRTMLTEEHDALAREVAELADERERLAALVEERQRQQASREQDLAGEAQKAAEIARGVGDLEALIQRMEQEQAARAAKAAEAESARIAAGAAGQTDPAALKDAARLAPALPFGRARGLLPLPVSGKRLSGFGEGDGMFAKGVRFAAAPGAPVTAPADGWVVYAGRFRSLGQLLILNTGDGYHVLLAGMERISVALNQFVLAGEPVATMRGANAGDGQPATSSSERPVLYVEFRKDKGSIDPSPWWAGTPGEKAGG
jgi:septal ring factor EnvC (AmiA/AmiB activator)